MVAIVNRENELGQESVNQCVIRLMKMTHIVPRLTEKVATLKNVVVPGGQNGKVGANAITMARDHFNKNDSGISAEEIHTIMNTKTAPNGDQV